MAKYTPMIQQYLDIKAQYPDAFYFFVLAIFTKCFLTMQSKRRRNWKLR